jgi:hypothetical protein
VGAKLLLERQQRPHVVPRRASATATWAQRCSWNDTNAPGAARSWYAVGQEGQRRAHVVPHDRGERREFAHLAVAYLCGSPTWWSPTWWSPAWLVARLAVAYLVVAHLAVAHLAVRPPGGSRIVSNGAANKPLIISSRTNNQDPR